jgi:hypothetical protein
MRTFGYPIPQEVGAPNPAIVVDLAAGSKLDALKTQRRPLELTFADGLCHCCLLVASGEQEIVVLDLDARPASEVRDFVTAVRAWPFCARLQIVGVSTRAGARRKFVASSGNVAVPRLSGQELVQVAAFITGGSNEKPEFAELADELRNAR